MVRITYNLFMTEILQLQKVNQSYQHRFCVQDYLADYLADYLEDHLAADLTKVHLARQSGRSSHLLNQHYQHRSLALRVLNVRHRMSRRGCSEQDQDLIEALKNHSLMHRVRVGTAMHPIQRRSSPTG